jgi:hypothetical protein
MFKKSPQQRADLRCCASCEYIFSVKEFFGSVECPVCHYGTYGARFVHGDRAYYYKKTQKPFLNKLVTYQTGKAIAEGHSLIAQAKQKQRQLFMDALKI